jgi:hypothetical protein
MATLEEAARIDLRDVLTLRQGEEALIVTNNAFLMVAALMPT